MRHLCALIAVSSLLVVGCKQERAAPARVEPKKTATERRPAASAPKWPTPRRTDGAAFTPLQPATQLPVGAKVELWWRATRSKNAFADHGPYVRGGDVHATKAPWGNEGGLSGAAIRAALRQAVGAATIGEVRLRGISAGVAGPDFKRGMVTVGDDASSFFNKAVGRTAEGSYQLFVDVDLAAGASR